MEEISVIGLNHITHPHLAVWDWLIAAYLFIGGMVAGILVLSAIRQLGSAAGEPPLNLSKAVAIAPLLLMAGMFFALLDLEKKLSVFWLYLTFNPVAPMSWVAWSIGLTIVASALWALAVLPKPGRPDLGYEALQLLARKLRPHGTTLARINLALGLVIGLGAGVLLSSFVARPLWNSPILPVLFLVSGLSTGAALLVLVAEETKEKLFLKKTDVALVTAEIVLLALFVHGHLTGSNLQFQAIMPFFEGGHALPFWVATIFLATSLPLIIFLDLRSINQGGQTRLHLSALLVLAAGFVLRLSLVYAGQLSTLEPLTRL